MNWYKTAQAKKKRDIPGLMSFDEHKGLHFETGKPIEFEYLKNTQKAPDMGSTFGQDIEPHGKYMILNQAYYGDEQPKLPWIRGKTKFNNPLVLAVSTDPEGHYGPGGWKARLSKAYDGLTGLKLAKAIRADGYDGIVTIGLYKGKPFCTYEIVDLTVIQ